MVANFWGRNDLERAMLSPGLVTNKSGLTDGFVSFWSRTELLLGYEGWT